MQLSLALETPRFIALVDERLRAAYGPVPRFRLLDPVSQLVSGIISSVTLDSVSKQAFATLCNAFATWEDMRDASPATVHALIEKVTHAEAKAQQVPRALRLIGDRRGAIDLDFLAAWPVEAARAWLMELPGVGFKVCAAVLNFSTLDHRALVADTHCLRVAKRVGLVPAQCTDGLANRLLDRQLPDGWSAADTADHHWLLKVHGQRCCRVTMPHCAACPLAAVCRARL